MEALEYDDIQGIIFRGYGNLPAASFVMLHIEADRQSDAKRWLAEIANEVTNAERKTQRESAVHLAFTLAGMRALGVDRRTRFSCEFEDEITAPHKRRILGDHGTSAPEHWRWGGTGEGDRPVHVLLMLYAKADHEADTTYLDALLAQHRARYQRAGLAEIVVLATRTLIERKEHFGFADGVAQPVIAGTRLAGRTRDANVVEAGEFILGYANNYGKSPESPTLPAALDGANLLDDGEDGERDLGKNGSYMVFRQLSQDVKAFWSFLDETARTNGTPDAQRRDWLAAKMVGRWRSGVSLMHAPDEDDPDLAPDDGFGFVEPGEGGVSDPYGVRCPLGSHIRRCNPRDSVFPGSDELLTEANVHRILRRGRAYGEPVAPSMQPDDVLAAEDDGQERGLHFICFNTDLGRQFEFVQHTWVNNPKFAGMYSELDPLVGDHGQRHRLENDESTFTIPAEPVRHHVTGIERYVHVRGGAYFFLPGVKAIRVLAELP